MTTTVPIIAVVRDLFFAVRIKETLLPHGYQVTVARSAADLDDLFSNASVPPALLIIDLAFTAVDPPALIAKLKGDSATSALPILAFGSHLDHAARTAALAAGADRVIPNSKLADDLPGVVARYARPAVG